MPKILKSDFQTELNFVVDCFVPNSEYNPFKERLLSQILKTVEVPGFRKGKVPVQLAMQKVDPIKLEQTVFRETIDKFYPEIDGQVRELLKEKNRVFVNSVADLDPEFTTEKEDGFQFRITLNLLPEVDLSVLSGLEITEPNEDDIENRLSSEEFFQREKSSFLRVYNNFEETDRVVKEDSQVILDINEEISSIDNTKRETKDVTVNLGTNQFPPDFEKELAGLKAGDEKEFELDLPTVEKGVQHFKFKVKINKVKYPKFSTFAEVLESSGEAKSQFPAEEDFEKYLTDIYNRETDDILTTLKRRKTIREVLEAIADFSLDEGAIKQEVERIVGILKERSKEDGKTIQEVFQASGLPGSEEKVDKNADVEKLVGDYVRKEFKLVEILRTVYYLNVESKITEQELDTVMKQIKQNPARFNVEQKDLSSERLADIAFDRLLRDKAFNWILGQIKYVPAKIQSKSGAKTKAKKTEQEENVVDVDTVEVKEEKKKPVKSTKSKKAKSE